MRLVRAHTVASRLSAVAPSACDVHNPQPLRPKPKPKVSIFQLQAAQSLPILNLRRTLSWYLLSTAKRNVAFLAFVKRHYRSLTYANRCGSVLGLLTLAIPIPRTGTGGEWWWWDGLLVAVAVALSLPAPLCACAMLSLDMLALLVRQYEFWFFTVANVITWTVLAVLCRDVRGVFIAVLALELQLLISMDANFRTFVPAAVTGALSIPVLCALVIAVYVRQLRIPAAHFEISIQLGELRVEIVEIFVNASLTLLVFFVRLAYNKRKLLRGRRSRTRARIVRCVIARCPLVLRPLACHATDQQKKLTQNKQLPNAESPAMDRTCAYGTRIMLKQLGITSPKLVPTMKAGRVTSARQQLSLVSLRLSTIDADKTILRGFGHMRLHLKTGHLVVLYSIGCLGLLLSGASILVPGHGMGGSSAAFLPLPAARASVAMLPVAGFVCTLVFCGSVACVYQCDIARAMFRNFSFVFPSLQFSLASICLADAMQWDSRCWAVASFGMWFHWVLFLDALPPPSREKLQFRRQMAIVVVLAMWLGVCSVLYAIVVDSPMLRDRVLMCWRVSDDLPRLTMGIKSILLNRVVTILLWTLRLLWQIFQARGTELVLVKGTLEFFCPFDPICHMTASLKSTQRIKMVESHETPREPIVLLPLSSSLDSSEERQRSSSSAISAMSVVPQTTTRLPCLVSVLPDIVANQEDNGYSHSPTPDLVLESGSKLDNSVVPVALVSAN